MIVGLGVDIVGVARFSAALERTPGVAARLLTPTEREGAVPSLAARFAAKEAVSKALGAPPGLRWLDVEIGREPGGRPSVQVRGTVRRAADNLGVRRWHVSLSHDGGMVVATAIAES